MTTLPTLLFNQNGEVSSESNLRAFIPVPCTNDDLAERFLHSLKNGDKQSFRRFCLCEFNLDRDDANYIIYPLIGNKWIPFRIAFCEKISVEGEPMTAVFFANQMDELYPLMSPASPICRDISGKLLCDILNLRHFRRTNLIPPEALLLFEQFPIIEDSALKSDADTHVQCDLFLLTQKIFDEFIAASPDMNLEFSLKLIPSALTFNRPANQIIVPCPLEAYIYLTILLGYILFSISDDHCIRGELQYIGPGSEVSYQIESSRASLLRNGCSNVEDLFPESHNLSSLARTASTIAHLFDLRTDLSVNSETGMLHATIGIGLDKILPSEFHYSAPYDRIRDILHEAMRLFA